MAFKKNGETEVFKKENKVSPKYANKNESNRYTIDDLVEDSDADQEVSLVMEESDENHGDKDVSN